MKKWSWLALGLSWACSSPSAATDALNETVTGSGGSAASSSSATSSGNAGSSGHAGTAAAGTSGPSGGGGATSDDAGVETSPEGGGAGGQGGVVGSDAAPDVRQVCAAFADTLCAKLETCSSFVLGALYGDVVVCRERTTLACLPSFGAPGTSATPAKTAACQATMAGLGCPAFLAGDLGAACKTDPGTVLVNGACADDAQCATTFCARAPDAACGVCQPPTSAGAACVRNSCSAGTVCPAGQSTCITPVAGKVNDSCTAQEQCDLAHAVGCNTSSGRCLTLTLATAQGTCGADFIFPTSYAVCPASGTCSATLGGRCSAAAKEGEPCSTADTGTHCLPPARCVGGRCTLSDGSLCR
jgi:hypothetical protein